MNSAPVFEQGSPEWHAWRKEGIGATDAAAIAGKSHWGTELTVYAKKVGVEKEYTTTPVQEWGNRIETLLLDKFMEVHDDCSNLIRGGLFMADWRRCSLDGSCDIKCPAVAGDSTAGIAIERVGIECKTARSADEWKPVPDGYYAQVQWQMHVTGMRRTFFSVLVAGCDWFEREVNYDAEYCAMLEERCSAAWKRIQDRTPPPPMHVLADLDGSALSQLSTIQESAEPIALSKDEVTKFYLLKDAAEKTEAALKAFKSDLQYKMSGGSCLTYEGKTFASYISRAGSTTVDSKLLKAKWPDIYAQVCRTGAPITYPRIG